MAFATGTATDQNDLWTKLKAFLTADPTLVAAGQAWTVAWQLNADELVLRGPGLSNQDQVYIGLKKTADFVNDRHYISLRGMSGVLPLGASVADHINVTPSSVRMFMDVGPMTYWFAANGRRFVVVVKISTVFETMYGGLFLPYGTPLSYPYPLFVGGSTGPDDTNASGFVPDWRSTHVNHRHFFSPVYGGTTGSNILPPSAWMLDPSGQWLRCAQSTSVTGSGDIGQVFVGPDYEGPRLDGGSNLTGLTDRYSTDAINARLRDCFGGQFPLAPLSLYSSSPADQSWGVLDGCFRVAGVGNSSENIITEGGVDHLTVQNVFRTSTRHYWALALE